VEVVASLSQGRTAAAQCGLFTYKSVPVIFEPPCKWRHPSIDWEPYFCMFPIISIFYYICAEKYT